MAYSRKIHKKLLTISDSIGGILDGKEKPDYDIQEVLEKLLKI